MELTPTLVADDLVVSLEYSLTVDGEVIDSSGETPLEYLHGHHNIIAGLEQALAGMQLGETRQVAVAPAQAYGEYDPEALYTLPKSQFPSTFDLHIGAGLRVRSDDGHVLSARVASIDGEDVKIDLNHPLAGKTLNFNATIAGLRLATADELAAGRVGGAACTTCGSSDGCSGSCC